MSRIRSLWRNLVHRDRVDDDLDDELRAVFDLIVAERIASGMRRASRIDPLTALRHD